MGTVYTSLMFLTVIIGFVAFATLSEPAAGARTQAQERRA